MTDIPLVNRIGQDLKPTFPSKPSEDDICSSVTVNLCTTTLSYAVVAKRGLVEPGETPAPKIPFTEILNKRAQQATTTKTSTISFCTSVTGCGVTDITETSTVYSTAAPTPHVIIPKDPKNVGNIRSTLQKEVGNNFFESATTALGTVFFYVPGYNGAWADQMKTSGDVDDAYIPRGQLTKQWYPTFPDGTTEDTTHVKSSVTGEMTPDFNSSHFERSLLSKRAQVEEPWEYQKTDTEMIILSWSPGFGRVPVDSGSYKYDSSAGQGTFVYSIDFGVTPSYAVFSDLPSPMEFLFPGPLPVSGVMENDAKGHGSKCLAKAVGRFSGLARKARVTATVIDYSNFLTESWLDALVKVHEDIRSKGRGPKAVINMSISLPKEQLTDAYLRKMGKCIRFMFFPSICSLVSTNVTLYSSSVRHATDSVTRCRTRYRVRQHTRSFATLRISGHVWRPKRC